MYVGHVGDSSVVLGIKDKATNQLKAHMITVVSVHDPVIMKSCPAVYFYDYVIS